MEVGGEDESTWSREGATAPEQASAVAHQAALPSPGLATAAAAAPHLPRAGGPNPCLSFSCVPRGIAEISGT